MVCCCRVNWLASPGESRRKNLWQETLSVALVVGHELHHICTLRRIKVLLLCYAAFKITC
jgi:hypothetical protein